MKIEEKFEHILKNSIYIQDPDDSNTIGWFYPSESELRHKKLCTLMNKPYEQNINNYKLLIIQDVKNDTFYIHYGKIWEDFYDEKGWNYDEVQSFTQERLEQHLKRKGVTTEKTFSKSALLLEQRLKRKGVTTVFTPSNAIFELEQHLKRKGVTTNNSLQLTLIVSEQHLKRKGVTTKRYQRSLKKGITTRFSFKFPWLKQLLKTIIRKIN